MIPLQGVKVLEIGDRRSGSLVGLVAAGLGADVVAHREPLADAALEAADAAFYDRGKRMLATAAEAAELVAHADVLVTDLSPRRLRDLELPHDETRLESVRRGLVQVAVTSHGLSGPHADWASDDITDWAAGGIGTMTRALNREPGISPQPVLPPGRQSDTLAGLAGAIGLFAGLREASARGRATLVDVSRVEVQASMGHHVFPAWLWDAVFHGRQGSPIAEFGYFVQAADRPVYVRAVEDRQWLALAALLGVPEEIAAERVDGLLLHYRDWSMVRTLIEPRIREWRANDLVAQGQAVGVPIADPARLDEVLESPQLAARDAWREVTVAHRSGRVPAIPLVEPARREGAILTTVDDVAEGWRANEFN